ncbi:HAAS signaling domain-containing protein [Hyphobacterium sp.]|uniref:HAAS signaling domain-containing protein n=1 Tax=Hyphobacterium sp. TaxID=2004662 RepID=UPI003748B1E4
MTLSKDKFLSRLDSCLAGISESERRDILDEARSHLEDCAREGEQRLAEALAGFGTPENYARAFIEEAQLRKALVSGSPGQLLLSVLSVAGRSVLAFVGFILISIGYLFAGTFFLLVVVELVLPAQTGLFTGPDVQPFALGVMAGDGPPPGTTEHLGAFMAPVMAVAGGVTTVLTLLFSRLVVARLLKRR